MSRKRSKPEEIVVKLCQADVLVGQHRSMQRKALRDREDEAALKADIV